MQLGAEAEFAPMVFVFDSDGQLYGDPWTGPAILDDLEGLIDQVCQALAQAPDSCRGDQGMIEPSAPTHLHSDGPRRPPWRAGTPSRRPGPGFRHELCTRLVDPRPVEHPAHLLRMPVPVCPQPGPGLPLPFLFERAPGCAGAGRGASAPLTSAPDRSSDIPARWARGRWPSLVAPGSGLATVKRRVRPSGRTPWRSPLLGGLPVGDSSHILMY